MTADQAIIGVRAARAIRLTPGLNTAQIAAILAVFEVSDFSENTLLWALYHTGHSHGVGQALNGTWYHATDNEAVRNRLANNQPPCPEPTTPDPWHTPAPEPWTHHELEQAAKGFDTLATLLTDINGRWGNVSTARDDYRNLAAKARTHAQHHHDTPDHQQPATTPTQPA